ncbi:DUF4097 domain-containing protein [Echinicola shivajiensis]|uniref:DUF4097 domain-containing protein n=1 Tax=Echinicola shivajiensis TaxID=1035916 RepID=UPI001BFC7CD3|nr:DUF4097 domain-containing protein [Echinicola shivajiensis]
MKTSFRYIGVLIFLFGISLGYSHGQSKIEKSFDNIEKLEIQGGSISLSYEGNTSQSSIKVTADLGDDQNADKNLVFVTVGNTLKISYQKTGNWNNNNNKRYIHITGPEVIVLKAANSSGKMHIKGVASELTELTASSGIIQVEDISGNLKLAGSSGKIEVNSVEGDVECNMTSGMMDLEYIKGNTSLSSSSGRITAKHVAGELNVKITSGSVSMEDISTLGKLKLSSGMMKAKKVGFGPNTSFSGSSGMFNIKANALLDNYNYDLNAGSGMVKVGDMSSSDHLHIDHGADHTVKGNIGSGMITIEKY